jgi:hypothetical protein
MSTLQSRSFWYKNVSELDSDFGVGDAATRDKGSRHDASATSMSGLRTTRSSLQISESAHGLKRQRRMVRHVYFRSTALGVSLPKISRRVGGLVTDDGRVEEVIEFSCGVSVEGA